MVGNDSQGESICGRDDGGNNDGHVKECRRPIEPGESAMMAGMAAGALRMAEAKAKGQREHRGFGLSLLHCPSIVPPSIAILWPFWSFWFGAEVVGWVLVVEK